VLSSVLGQHLFCVSIIGCFVSHLKVLWVVGSSCSTSMLFTKQQESVAKWLPCSFIFPCCLYSASLSPCNPTVFVGHRGIGAAALIVLSRFWAVVE